MPASFQFRCPFCEQQIEVPSEMQDQIANCPSCEEEIVLNQETAPEKSKSQTTTKLNVMEPKQIMEFADNYFSAICPTGIQWPSKNIYYKNHIPQKKLTNSKKTYAKFNSDEESVLLLMDDSALRSAKRGFVMTELNIYYSMLNKNKIISGVLPLDKIKTITFEKKLMSTNIIVNGKQFANVTQFSKDEGYMLNEFFHKLFTNDVSGVFESSASMATRVFSDLEPEHRNGTLNLKFPLLQLAPLFAKLGESTPNDLSSVQKAADESCIRVLEPEQEVGLPEGENCLAFIISWSMLQFLPSATDRLLLLPSATLYYSTWGGACKLIEYHKLNHVRKNKFKCTYRRVKFASGGMKKLEDLFKTSLASMKQAETSRLMALIEGHTCYDLTYLGGLPDTQRENTTLSCTENGVLLFKKSMGGSMRGICTVPWSEVARIEYTSSTKEGAANKNALTTVGLLKGNATLLAAGLLSSGPKTKHFLVITRRDSTGYESQIMFESPNSQNIALRLNEQRSALYKPAETSPGDADPTLNNTPHVVAEKKNIGEEIKQLKDLLDCEAITKDEYEVAKKKLLSQI